MAAATQGHGAHSSAARRRALCSNTEIKEVNSTGHRRRTSILDDQALVPAVILKTEPTTEAITALKKHAINLLRDVCLPELL